ncbi:MAG: hypothetical protein HYS04_18720 [Acidobacteria bacterium]|nr:hypothetical protein [Acidobacteriota bacterium]
MVRTVLYLLLTIVLITFLRMVLGIIMREFGNLLGSPGRPGQSGPRQASRGATAGGELKRDPVCGTFVAPVSAIHKTVGGEVHYFCSPACRDKFRG